MSRDLKKTKKLISNVTYSNLLAPQATPKENVNIVLNYPYKKAAIFKNGSRPGKMREGEGTLEAVRSTWVHTWAYILDSYILINNSETFAYQIFDGFTDAVAYQICTFLTDAIAYKNCPFYN